MSFRASYLKFVRVTSKIIYYGTYIGAVLFAIAIIADQLFHMKWGYKWLDLLVVALFAVWNFLVRRFGKILVPDK